MSVTVASCHGPTRGTASGPSTVMSVALVALFEPRVASVVVPAYLPETGFVVIEQRDARHELGALPEVQMRHQQPRWSAVVGRQRRAVGLERNPRLAASDVGERQVRGVPGRGVGEHV